MIEDQYIENQNQIQEKTDYNQKKLDRQKEIYGQNLRQIQQKYQQQLEKHVSDLRLRLNAELHEIEERKNIHINELITNHKKTFDELRSFYNLITSENLRLIKSQKQELSNFKSLHEQNFYKITKLRQSNRKLEQPLNDALKRRQEMVKRLEQFQKDKMSLQNLRIKETTMKDKKQLLEKNMDELNSNFKQKLEEKIKLEDNFQDTAEEMVQYLNMNMMNLKNKVQSLEIRHEVKSRELGQLVQSSEHLPKVQEILETLRAKNILIENFRYLNHHSIKQFNDTLKVYMSKFSEMKLEFGDIGFELIPSVTSNFPAGLVSKN